MKKWVAEGSVAGKAVLSVMYKKDGEKWIGVGEENRNQSQRMLYLEIL